MIQRIYRAACPNCGAPIEFRSAASALAVCSYCNSTVVRDGDALRRIGKMADLFDDHSPLTLGTSGNLPAALAPRFQQPANAAFVVVGRIQYRYADGVWSEWSVALDDGSTLWLSEDNGRYALSRDLGACADAPPLAQLTGGGVAAGSAVSLGGRRFEITSVVPTTPLAAAGELPPAAAKVALPLSTPQGARSTVWIVDARSADGVITTIDYSDPAAPNWSQGAAVALADLRLQGLAEAGDGQGGRQLTARAFNCPSCGAPIEVRLTGTQSIVCPNCSAVVDLSQGVTADLQFFRQQRRFPPAIALGTEGTWAGTRWQVVGFARRSGKDDDGYDFAWQELLLFDRLEGFAFVVIASDGVSFVRTVQDSPEVSGARSARYDGRSFRAESAYWATVDYVEGEFYWRVRAGQRTRNVDYVSGDRVLSREAEQFEDAGAGSSASASPGADGRAADPRSVGGRGGEVVWSYGPRINGVELARAFGLASLPIQAAGSGTPIAFDAPAYDPNDMPRGLAPGYGAGAAGAAGGAGAIAGTLASGAAGAPGTAGAGGSAASAAAGAGSSASAAAGSGGAAGGGGSGGGAPGGPGYPGGPGGPGGGAGGGPGGGGPTSGSRAIMWLIIIVVVILVLVFVFSGPGGGGSSYSGGSSGYSGGGSSGSHK